MWKKNTHCLTSCEVVTKKNENMINHDRLRRVDAQPRPFDFAHVWGNSQRWMAMTTKQKTLEGRMWAKNVMPIRSESNYLMSTWCCSSCCGRWDLYSSCASTSAGIELMHNEVHFTFPRNIMFIYEEKMILLYTLYEYNLVELWSLYNLVSIGGIAILQKMFIRKASMYSRRIDFCTLLRPTFMKFTLLTQQLARFSLTRSWSLAIVRLGEGICKSPMRWWKMSLTRMLLELLWES